MGRWTNHNINSPKVGCGAGAAEIRERTATRNIAPSN